MYTFRKNFLIKRLKSVMEKPHSRKCHNHAVPVARLYDEVVPYGAARLRNIRNAAFFRALYIVPERKKRVRPERYSRNIIEICTHFLSREGLGTSLEIFLPIAVREHVLFVFIYISVNDIVPFGSAESIEERKIQDFFVLTQKPGVGLSARMSRSVNSRLLSRADSNRLPVIRETYGIRLSVF